MDLLVPLPPSWPDKSRLRVVPPQPLAWDMRRWLADVINAERVLGSRRLETVDGWPFDLIEADAPPRLVAIYHLGDYIAAAVIDGQASPSVVEVLTKARPDWSTDEILALSEIWSRP